jgi:MFS family permease
MEFSMTSHEQESPRSTRSNIADATENAAEGLAAAVSHTGPTGYQPPPLKRWTGRYMTLLFIASFAVSVAQLAPSVYSLAVRVQAIDPADKDTLLAVVLTIPAIFIIFVNPIVGILSDRTRSRFGRRRPWMIGGLAVGMFGLIVVGVAPTIPLVIVGWTIGYLGLTTIGSLIITHLGDALPEEQRGKVSGINGAIAQLGPIVGVIVSGMLVGLPFLLFFIPGVIAVLGSIAFLIRMNDPSTKHVEFERISILGVFVQMVFNPRHHKDFAWVWLSKALVFIALYMMSIYTVYFLSDRLDMSVGAIAGTVALVGGLGVFGAIGGALVSGFLSDRLRRRKPLLVIAGFILAGGLVLIGTTTSLTQYIVGGVLFSLGSGVFGAVDQALSLDVLPDRQSPGRFMAIIQLANEIPKAIAPILAGLLVAIGVGGNYQLVYFAAAVCALLGGFLVLRVKSVR